MLRGFGCRSDHNPVLGHDNTREHHAARGCFRLTTDLDRLIPTWSYLVGTGLTVHPWNDQIATRAACSVGTTSIVHVSYV